MQRFLQFCVFLLIFSQTFGETHAQTRDLSQALQKILDSRKGSESAGPPGIVAAVICGDQVTALGAAGVRRAGSPEKVTTEDRFHLGSCTKSMTATLIAMLVEEGKLSWNSTVGEIFKENSKSMDSKWR